MWNPSRFGPCGSSEGRRLADERLPRAEASLAQMAGASHRPGQRMHSSIGHASIEAWVYGRDGLGLVFCRFSSEEVRKQKAGSVACLRRMGQRNNIPSQSDCIVSFRAVGLKAAGIGCPWGEEETPHAHVGLARVVG